MLVTPAVGHGHQSRLQGIQGLRGQPDHTGLGTDINSHSCGDTQGCEVFRVQVSRVGLLVGAAGQRSHILCPAVMGVVPTLGNQTKRRIRISG